VHKNNHKLRIGIVGAGNIVRARHLPALKNHPEVEIVAVSNSTYESSEKFCQEFCPSATPMRNWPDLLALPDIDIIWIGTPPVMHSAVTVSALEAGKHVIVEKPLEITLKRCDRMIEACAKHGVTLATIFPSLGGTTVALVW